MRVAILGPTVIGRTTVDGKTHQHAGGLPYYVGNIMASLGCEVTAITTFGHNDKAFIQESMLGIHLHQMPCEGTIIFQQTYAIQNPDERTMTVNNIGNHITYKQVADDLQQYDILVLGPMFSDNLAEDLYLKPTSIKVYGGFGLFQESKEGMLVWKDPERALELLRHIEYIFVDGEEAKFLTGKNDVQDAGKAILRNGAKHAVITLGSKGSLHFSEKGTETIPAFPPRSITDPTGCGEVYLGAFMYAIDRYASIPRAGAFAAMAGTMKIEIKGSLRASPQEVIARLKAAGSTQFD